MGSLDALCRLSLDHVPRGMEPCALDEWEITAPGERLSPAGAPWLSGSVCTPDPLPSRRKSSEPGPASLLNCPLNADDKCGSSQARILLATVTSSCEGASTSAPPDEVRRVLGFLKSGIMTSLARTALSCRCTCVRASCQYTVAGGYGDDVCMG